MNTLIETRKIPAGSIVKIGGLPFEVVEEIEIRGTLGNFQMLADEGEEPPA